MGQLEHLRKLLKMFNDMNLTQVVDKLFSNYEGEMVNVNRAEDIRLCQKANAIFQHLTPTYLDFGPLGIRYRLNTNTRKVWCPSDGIRADRDHLNVKWRNIVHHKIVRHDCKTYLEGQ